MNPVIIDITGIISGLISASVFLTLLFIFLRPKIKISPQIAKWEKNGKTVYAIKVINKSCLFTLCDVHVELTLIRNSSAPSGLNVAFKAIEMKNSRIWFIDRRPIIGKSKNATYAIIFKTLDDLNDEWEDSVLYAQFKVIAKHGLSGLPKVKMEQYHDKKTSIKEGRFKYGNTFEIR